MSTTVRKSFLPKKYHEAVLKWRDQFLPDYGFLEEHWDHYFPHKPTFELCAYHDCSVCPNIEVGLEKGREKYGCAKDMNKEQADNLLKAVKAQASTELGSIQQHRKTLARANEEQDQFWILRMMAEELRHGYQMFSIMLEDDWTSVTDQSGEDMFEEVLSMRTGSHVLGAFNIDFDSFLDNSTFCAVIDRVGKYQLDMQKVSSYRPMSESMPPMLREEAFHMATGVAPLRRWAEEAAVGEGTISLTMLQEAIHKWFPRGLDMFGDERGGGRNVKFGFKSMRNVEAQSLYIEEVQEVIIDDLNVRVVRARAPQLSKDEAREVVKRVAAGETHEALAPDEMLRLPDRKFFRRRGPDAFMAYDVDGHLVEDEATFRKHLLARLPDAYAMGRDLIGYLDLMKRVFAGELKPEEAAQKIPSLSRVAGTCPCSNAVRWIDPTAN